MAKRKLSREQKRKQKKQKRRKPRKQLVGWARKTGPSLAVKPVDPAELEARMVAAQAKYGEQEKRIQAVFGGTLEDYIPQVTEDTLQIYFEHIKDNLELPCLLTGIESMGYFGWEERYSFGYGSKAEYQQLRKTKASFQDEYVLKTFAATVDMDWEDIVVDVSRTADDKEFTIPLSELQAADEASAQYQLLNDYTVWYVNWR